MFRSFCFVLVFFLSGRLRQVLLYWFLQNVAMYGYMTYQVTACCSFIMTHWALVRFDP